MYNVHNSANGKGCSLHVSIDIFMILRSYYHDTFLFTVVILRRVCHEMHLNATMETSRGFLRYRHRHRPAAPNPTCSRPSNRRSSPASASASALVQLLSHPAMHAALTKLVPKMWPKLSAMAASSASLLRLSAPACSPSSHFALRSVRLDAVRDVISGNMRRLPVAAVGMVATVALVGGPKSPILNSGREPSTAIASLGQARAASGAVSEFGKNIKDEPQTVVTPQWLHDRLESDTKIKVLDASWYMPNEKRDTLKEYKEEHIPGAVFFDLEKISDITSDMPHMLPSETAFEQAASALGIQNDDWLVVYDTKGLFSAARVWWMFRVFGHEKVWLLDGGLPNWKASGFPVISEGPQLLRGEDAVAAVQKVYSGKEVPKSQYKATLQPHLVWSVEQVRDNLEEKKVQVIDARGKARFDGTVPELRKGVRGGHIPGSKSVPFPEVLTPSGVLLTPEELRSKFESAGVPTEGPIVASCGTGVTACILALALHRIGKQDVAVYDGSWTEWGSRSDTPVETNAPSTA